MTSGIRVESMSALLEAVRSDSAGTRWQPAGEGSLIQRGYAPSGRTRGLRATFLDSVISYPHEDLTITVGSGCSLARLKEALARRKQWLPGIMGVPSRTVGGWLGADARGPLVGAYGSARDYLLRVQWVNGEADILEAGAPVVKSVAGYDFMKLMIGSLGELGFMTEVTLKVLPRPRHWAIWTRIEPSLELLSQVVSCAVPLSPAAVILGRVSHEEQDRLSVLFCGHPKRTSYQLSELTKHVTPTEANESEAVPGLSVVSGATLLWGGVLPQSAGHFGEKSAWSGPYSVDLMRGHLWFGSKIPVLGSTLEALRRLASEGEGHLHVDSLEMPSWGREEPAEIELARRIKDRLDPEQRWVCGRQPGHV